MLSIILDKEQEYISSLELFQKAGYSKKVKYAHWSKRYITQNVMAIPEKDFVVGKPQSFGGRPSQDYLLTSEFAFRIITALPTESSDKLRAWLWSLVNAVKQKDLITPEQSVFIYKFLDYFKFKDNQDSVEKDSIKKLADEFGSFGAAQNFRNKELDYSKEQVAKEFEEWCLITSNTHLLDVRNLTRREKTFYFNRYKLIYIAVYDFWAKNDMPDVDNWAKVVMKIAKLLGIEILPTNAQSLFNDKETICSIEELENKVKMLN